MEGAFASRSCTPSQLQARVRLWPQSSGPPVNCGAGGVVRPDESEDGAGQPTAHCRPPAGLWAAGAQGGRQDRLHSLVAFKLYCE